MLARAASYATCGIVDNASVARAFDELADLLELKGESPFKLKAYRDFAEQARGLVEPLSALALRGELIAMPGVGKAIATKTAELLVSGTCDALERARLGVPPSLRDLLRVPGLGAKSVRALWQGGGITTLGDLLRACEHGRVAAMAGFGAKKQEKILDAVRALLDDDRGMLLGAALEAAARITKALRRGKLGRAFVAGEARRGVEIVKTLLVLVQGVESPDIAVALDAAKDVMGARAVEIEGSDVVVTFAGGERAYVRGVPDAKWTFARITTTGNDEHLRWLEQRAAAMPGATSGVEGALEAVCARARREEDVYAALGLPYAPPESREGPTLTLPERFAGVRGIFHVHTDWSDGTASIVDMAREAAKAGFSYIGISDHTQAAIYANGLDPKRLLDQAAAVAIARREVHGIAILHGTECDILEDGTLDLDDATLSQLDFVIASVHTAFALTHEQMTARIVRAVSHPLVTILGHPTGRLLLARRGYTFDVEAVARAAAANDTYLEINANPQRLDLSDVMVRRAAAAGASFAIDPDAHAPRGVLDTELGVTLARRAGVVSAQVLNAREREDLVATLAARKERALGRLAHLAAR